jgi:hypothetical protein
MMTGEPGSGREADKAVIYQIRLKGHLSSHWMGWFDRLTITLEEDGTTLLQGPVIDQAALHGILKKVRDLGLPLLFVHAMDLGPQEAKQASHE